MMQLQYIILICTFVLTIHNKEIIIKHSQYDQEIEVQKLFHNVYGQFYVDIGAYDPFNDSKTTNLYSRKWTGVNVEPHPKRASIFTILRPQTITISATITKKTQILTLFLKPDGESLTKSGNQQILQKNLNSIQIPSLSIKNLCQRYFYRRPLFVSINTLGGQAQALKHNNWDNQICIPDVYFITNHVSRKNQITQNQLPSSILLKKGFKLFKTIDVKFGYQQIYIIQRKYNQYSKKYQMFNESQFQFVNQDCIVSLLCQKQEISCLLEKHYDPLISPYYKHYSIAYTALVPAQLNRISSVNNKRFSIPQNSQNQDKNRPIFILNYDSNLSQIIIREGQIVQIRNFYCRFDQKKLHFWHFQIRKNNGTFNVYILDHKYFENIKNLPIIFSHEINQVSDYNIYDRQKKYWKVFQTQYLQNKSQIINENNDQNYTYLIVIIVLLCFSVLINYILIKRNKKLIDQ